MIPISVSVAQGARQPSDKAMRPLEDFVSVKGGCLGAKGREGAKSDWQSLVSNIQNRAQMHVSWTLLSIGF